MSARGWLLFAAMSVIWGIPYLLIKIAARRRCRSRSSCWRGPLVGAAGAAAALTLSRADVADRCAAHWKPVLAFAFFRDHRGVAAADRTPSGTSPARLTGLLIAAAPIVAAVLDRVSRR